MKTKQDIENTINVYVKFIDSMPISNTQKGLFLLAYLRGISDFANGWEYLVASQTINNTLKERDW